MKADLKITGQKIIPLQEEMWAIEKFEASEYHKNSKDYTGISAVRLFAIMSTEYADKNHDDEFDSEQEFVILQEGSIIPFNTQHKGFLGFVFGKATKEKIQSVVDNDNPNDLRSIAGGFIEGSIDKNNKFTINYPKSMEVQDGR